MSHRPFKDSSHKFLKRLAKRLAPDLRDLLILWFTSQRPAHGYEIIKKFDALGTPELKSKANRVYPELEKMKARGFLDVFLDTSLSHKRPRKVYHLTPDGRRHLLDEIEEMRRTLNSVEQDLESIYRDLKERDEAP